MPERREIPVTEEESVVAVHHESGADGDATAWLVYCHGFRSDKSGSYERRCERAVAEGYDAVRFDFRGCGESDGSFAASTLAGRLADLRAVLDSYDPSTVVLFGSSFGGTVALHAAVDDPRVAAVVTRAPVTYARAFDGYRRVVDRDGECQFDDGTAIDERFFEALDDRPFADVVDGLDRPVAIFHGRDDASVPVEDSVEAVGALRTDALLETFAGEEHLFSSAAEARTMDLTFAWLDALDVSRCGE